MKLESYFADAWHAGSGPGQSFRNPVNQEILGTVDATGVDIARAFDHARTVGGATLRDLSPKELEPFIGMASFGIGPLARLRLLDHPLSRMMTLENDELPNCDRLTGI